MKRQVLSLSLLLVLYFVFVVPVLGQATNTCNVYTSTGNPYPCCDNDGNNKMDGAKDGNCTWWAWKRAQDTWGNMPSTSWGRAKYWADGARNSNSKFQVLTSPAPESIGVRTTGTYGHVAWVVTVNSTTVGTTEMNCFYPNLAQGGWKEHPTGHFNGGFIYPAARISAITPSNPNRASYDRDFEILGDGFAPNLRVEVTFPNGGKTTLSGAQIKNVTRKRFIMRATLNATGAWRFRVLNPQGGTGSQSNLFSIYVW